MKKILSHHFSSLNSFISLWLVGNHERAASEVFSGRLNFNTYEKHWASLKNYEQNVLYHQTKLWTDAGKKEQEQKTGNLRLESFSGENNLYGIISLSFKDTAQKIKAML